MPTTYRRHEPEKTILHQVVREHLETLLAQGRARDGEGYPRWVERQFRDYLNCGLLSQGFARGAARYDEAFKSPMIPSTRLEKSDLDQHTAR